MMKLLNIGLFLLLMHGTVLRAEDDTQKESILILASAQNETVSSFITTIQKRLDARYAVSHIKALQTDICDNLSCLYVAVGPKALETLLEKTENAAIVATFVSSIAYQQILKKFPEKRLITTIHAEPSLKNQLEIVKTLFPKHCKLGFLYSEKSAYALDQLMALSSQYQITLVPHKLDDKEPITIALDAIQQTDVLLAIPDNAVYNRDTFRQIILTTYRREQPVIGFSQSFVKAGALGTSYYNIDDLADKTAETANIYHLTQKLREPSHIDHYAIVFNDSVANSLNISLREKDFNTDDIQFIKGIAYISSEEDEKPVL